MPEKPIFLLPTHKEYKLKRVSCNDKPPNYREKGQLRIVHCYSCDTRLVCFGASDITTCPHCLETEPAYLDKGELWMLLFESLTDTLINYYRGEDRALLASLAHDILESRVSEAAQLLPENEDTINHCELEEDEVIEDL